ncbi:MAG: DotU family type IV/VI secretion system protein [Marivibrio sp.]|uniref:DotU family type IV/VI secretion system protein n=1 Tax=Marivibrio sp. TaxID=2039719 RepID=UPI0032EFA778
MPPSAAAPAATGSAGAYVLDQFREFYDELMRLRAEALRGGRARAAAAKKAGAKKRPEPPPEGVIRPLPPPLPGKPKPADPDPPEPEEDAAAESGAGGAHLSAEEALQQLQSLLEMQALEAGRRGGEYGVLYYKEAQYVMAALADEIFLHLDWPGRTAWREDLLETRLFGSYAAGEKLFQRLDRLLQSGDRVQAELAVVYLLALSLGFRGKYRGAKHDQKLIDYRKQLYYYIYQRRPDLADQTRRLTPQAYDQTQGEARARMLPSPARWYWLFAAVLLGFILLGHVLWTGAVQELDALLRSGGPG